MSIGDEIDNRIYKLLEDRYPGWHYQKQMRAQAIEILKSKKYQVHKYPSFNGTPVLTGNIIIAIAIAFLRKLTLGEIRIIESKTGKHVFIL